MSDSEDILRTAAGVVPYPVAVYPRHGREYLGLLTPSGRSKLAIDSGGEMSGSVSGGCVEGAVVEAALEIIRTGHPRLLEFPGRRQRAHLGSGTHVAGAYKSSSRNSR